MSGGSFNYSYRHVEDMANDLRQATPLERVFAAHLDKVAKAMKAVEWVTSSDWGEGDADEAMRAVVSPTDELKVATADALDAADVLRSAIDRAAEAAS